MTNKDALEAFKRISSDAIYGIGSGDYEIMNKGGFDKDMERHNLDAEIVRQALEVNQDLVEALKEAVRLWDEHKATHEYHITSWKQALAKAEAVGGDQ